MVSLSMMAMLLSCGFMAQAPDRPGEWVVIESKEGPFSVAMPTRPAVTGGEKQVPGGTMRWKFYTCKVGAATFSFRQQIYPVGGVPTSVMAPMDETARRAKERGMAVSKAPILVQGVSGMELAVKEEAPVGTITKMVRVRMLVQDDIVYSVSALSGPGQPLPPETTRFFDSLRFKDEPADQPSKGGGKPTMTKPAAPARRKQIGKVVHDDRTADAAVRTFLMAMEAGDEETLRQVTLPNPEFDWLLRGELTRPREIRELKQQVLKARVDRLKQGDRVQIAPNDVHVILPSEVGRDRAALRIHGAPAYAPLHLVRGHWKVDPAPMIAARKAAK